MSDIKIEDITGVGKVLPLEKLLDWLGMGIGRAFKGYFNRVDADGEAYRIEKTGQAKINIAIKAAEAMKELGGKAEMEFKDGMINLLPVKQLPVSDTVSLLQEATLSERADEREKFQQNKRQHNLENVTSYAAEVLKDEAPVENQPVDEDWTTRFINITQDVSTEEMQRLWGKILAGEIKQPGSYSLRTMELLKNITKKEAETFMKVCDLAIYSNGNLFIYRPANNALETKFKISYKNISELVECGLLLPDSSAIYQVKSRNQAAVCHFSLGGYVIKVTVPGSGFLPGFNLNIYTFTNAGKELFNLIEQNTPFDYITTLAKEIKKQAKFANIKYGKYTDLNVDDPWERVQFDEDLMDFPFTESTDEKAGN